MQFHLIKSIGPVPPTDTDFIPVEYTAKNMSKVEQFAERVLDFTSKYNISFSISYAPGNLVGRYVKYPSYGDFPETYILRSYGKWWRQSEAFQQDYMPQDIDPLGSEDYVTLGFETPVVPRDVCIYETYNPGAVVRIWGRFTGRQWMLLWHGLPQECEAQSRKFHPPIRKTNYLINEIRLEFNQSHLSYHTSIDAVLLGGFEPKSILHFNILQGNLLDDICLSEGPCDDSSGDSGEGCSFISNLPYDVIVQIFRHLDLRSLSRCARVNKMWYEASCDSRLYKHLSLKKYWHLVTDETLRTYFGTRCKNVKKLDFSWCTGPGDRLPSQFNRFLGQCCQQLTHLSLCHCDFVTNGNIETIATNCKDLCELRLRNTLPDSNGFQHLATLNKLVILDISSTNVGDETLVKILKANPLLEHLILDFCESIQRMDQIVETVTQFNPLLRSWSSFKTTTLTAQGAALFSRCPNLRELDLGWCFIFTMPSDCLERIAQGCVRLKRLIISQWRGVTDQMLLTIIANCKNLTQLDLLGIRNITTDTCEKALKNLPHLRLLDISFCDLILSEQISTWRMTYPHVTIQRSCQYDVRDYLN